MKVKLALVAALSVAVLTMALLWLMDEKVAEERKSAMESGLHGSVNAISQALQADLRGLRRTLPLISAGRDRLDWKSFRPFIGFAQIRFEDAPPVLGNLVTDPKGPGAAWTAESLTPLLASWKKNTAPVDGATIQLFSDTNKNRFVGVILRDADRVWLAISGPEILQNLIDLQKGPRQILGVMNSQGRVLAHSTAEYVNTTAPTDSVYARVLSEPGVRADKNFEQGVTEPSAVSYEKIPRSDLVVLASRPLEQIRHEREETILFGGIAGAGILLVSLSLIWSTALSWEKKQAVLVQNLRQKTGAPMPAAAKPALAPGTTSAAPGGASAVVSAQSSGKTNENALRVASALGHELRGPLTSILSWSQMVLAQTSDSQISDPVNSILRETRSARTVLDKLLAFAGEKNEEPKMARLETALAAVLKDYEPRIAQKHIRLKKDLRETSEVFLSLSAVEIAIKQILSNSMESMERMMKQEITIELAEDENSVRLKVVDSGEGIEEKNLEKIYDPFFTTRNAVQHMGLGLPAALGIVKEHGGELKIESVRGKGTTVTMIFPKKQQAAPAKEVKMEVSAEKKLVIPTQAPLELSDEKTPPLESMGDFAQSPADVDIEQLLELPEDKKIDLKKTIPVSAAPQPHPSPSVVTPPLVAPVPTASAEDPVVGAPSFKAPEVSSKLDGIKVAVRRPGEKQR